MRPVPFPWLLTLLSARHRCATAACWANGEPERPFVPDRVVNPRDPLFRVRASQPHRTGQVNLQGGLTHHSVHRFVRDRQFHVRSAAELGLDFAHMRESDAAVEVVGVWIGRYPYVLNL